MPSSSLFDKNGPTATLYEPCSYALLPHCEVSVAGAPTGHVFFLDVRTGENTHYPPFTMRT